MSAPRGQGEVCRSRAKRTPAGIKCRMSAAPQPSATAGDAPRARPMMSVAEALERVLASAHPIARTEEIDTFYAGGRVLAAALTARLDVPAADNSQMDGYAVRAADLEGASADQPVTLAVSQRIPAGHVATTLVTGSAARIFTGALIPEGADAVVMQEQAAVDQAASPVAFSAQPEAGEWIRRRGEDIENGQIILEAGTRLGPQHLGLAASSGAARVPVMRRPRVAIFSTGDELAMPGEVAIEDLKPGALYNSNRYTMRALIEALGCEVVDLGIVPDTLAATRAALVRAAADSDCIVTSGGVSVGEEDHIRPAVAAEGRIDMWQLAIKPGKPFAFGEVGDTLFVGLPGNPVSGFVTFLVLVRPLLLRLQGIRDVTPTAFTMRADFEWPRPDQRQEYLRTRINASGGLDVFVHQGSAVLTSTVWADGLVENPPGRRIAKGDPVRFIPFSNLIG